MGFVKGKASPCCFFHKKWGIRTVVHGDDFLSEGPSEHLKEMDLQMLALGIPVPLATQSQREQHASFIRRLQVEMVEYGYTPNNQTRMVARLPTVSSDAVPRELRRTAVSGAGQGFVNYVAAPEVLAPWRSSPDVEMPDAAAGPSSGMPSRATVEDKIGNYVRTNDLQNCSAKLCPGGLFSCPGDVSIHDRDDAYRW